AGVLALDGWPPSAAWGRAVTPYCASKGWGCSWRSGVGLGGLDVFHPVGLELVLAALFDVPLVDGDAFREVLGDELRAVRVEVLVEERFDVGAGGDVELGGAGAAGEDVEADAHAPLGGQVVLAPLEGHHEVVTVEGDVGVDLEVDEVGAVLVAGGELGAVDELPVEGLLVE